MLELYKTPPFILTPFSMGVEPIDHSFHSVWQFNLKGPFYFYFFGKETFVGLKVRMGSFHWDSVS